MVWTYPRPRSRRLWFFWSVVYTSGTRAPLHTGRFTDVLLILAITCYRTDRLSSWKRRSHTGTVHHRPPPNRCRRSRCTSGSCSSATHAKTLAQDSTTKIHPDNGEKVFFATTIGHLQCQRGPWLQHATRFGQSLRGLGRQRSASSRRRELSGLMPTISTLIRSSRKASYSILSVAC